MAPAAISPPSTTVRPARFENLRSVQWRINLSILPRSSSIDELRRVAADSRRRYAGLRRRLLVDPHLRSNSGDLVMDNPLSQNPDSTWGRFFRNAELEKMVDQDLSRLYPEESSYFQTPGCQGMLRRILLLWCLRHPECGYRQGMHELLAPLLYVLHVDLERLGQVRKEHEDHFTDKFDDLSFHENDVTYNFDFKKFLDSMEDEMGSHGNSAKVRSLDELDNEIRTIILLSDAYGAEGELGIVLSEKFMEHDAYCMFDALMSGAQGGAVAMADFFAPPSVTADGTNLPPIIEAAAALYHLLSVVDSSLHSHLVELGVEPQYFGLRWLRVLFGREFSIGDLLLVWDEIFASDNIKLNKGADENDEGSSFGILSSPRGALIAAIAVSMILYLRSSLLATENATSCLQRLLNFPENVNLQKIIGKAKSFQALGLDTNISSLSSPFGGAYDRSKSVVVRGHSLMSDSISSRTPLTVVPDSYWEEKWRVMHKAEELRQSSLEKQSPNRRKRWSEKVRLSLSRTESDPFPVKVDRGKKDAKRPARRSLLKDLSRELGLEEDVENSGDCEISKQEGHPSLEEVEKRDGFCKDFTCSPDERCLSGNTVSEENSSIFSDPASPVSGANDHENDSEKSSVASNLSLDENDPDPQPIPEDPPLPVSHPPDDISQNSASNDDSTVKSGMSLKERKLQFTKFQWLWKFGRNAAGEEKSEKEGGALETTESATANEDQINGTGSSTTESSHNSLPSINGDAMDQNVMGTLKNLGQSMLEHIQVIESVFQQDRGQVGSLENFSKNVLVGKGQATAMTALKELRKISNILSEM